MRQDDGTGILHQVAQFPIVGSNEWNSDFDLT